MNTKAATIPQPLAQPRHLAAPESQPSFRAIARPLIDIVVPVLNEEKILQKSITTLDEYMAKHLPYRYQITIADNGSQDKTLEIAKRLAEKYQSVRVVSLAERGRGRALKRVWQSSPADILTYMDVDLSTSLDDFLTMIQPLVAGEAGVAIGSRLMKDSRTSRGLKREFISRCYNSIIKWTSCTKFSDAQCGFKAIRRDVAAKFLPKIKDNEWFFDTELLIKTERAGVPIYEQPVTWIEDTDSRVKIVKTAVDDLKGLYRVNKELDNRSWFEKWMLPVLLALTGALYLFGALHNGMANSYYAAAVQAASQDWTAWLGLAALFTGLAFNTKMLQGLMVLPAMALVYLVFARPPIVTRLLHVMFAGVITTMSTLWWSVLVWLTPAGSRPWVGSTNDNNIWSLIFGYNGLGRLLGGHGGGGGPGGGTPPSGGIGGTTTLQTAGSTTQTMADGAGMMPGGMGGGPGGGHGPGGTGFGGQTGIFRIFNNDFGPNIAWLLVLALAGGGLMLWILRKTPRTNRGRAAVIFWMLWLLIHIVIFSMTSGVIHPYYVVVMAPAVAALVGISLPFLWGAYTRRKPYAWLLPLLVGVTAVIAVMILGYAGTMTWLMWIVGLLGLTGMIGLLVNLYAPRRWLQNLAIITAIAACTLAPTVYTLATVNVAHTGSIPTAGPSSTAMRGSNNETSQANSQLVQYLLQHQNGATWLVAVASANESAAIQLTSGQPVMAVGGFNGSDTPLTLEQFKQLVKVGKVKYYAIGSHGRGGGGPGGGNNEIAAWVKQTGTVVNYGGSDVTLYELSRE